MSRDGYISGLRKLADLLENNPELPLPTGDSPYHAITWITSDKQVLAKLVRALGHVEKDYTISSFVRASRQLDDLHVEVMAWRDEVCEWVKTGEHEETEEVPDPDAPKVTRTRVVEDGEWQCAPLLENQ